MNTSTFVYVVFSLDEWFDIRKLDCDDDVCIDPDWSWCKENTLHEYMLDVLSVKSTVRCLHPVSAYYTKPSLHWTYPRRRIVCKVRIDNPSTQLVWYDDVLYVHLLNTLGNGKHTFLSVSEEEDQKMQNADINDCIASYDRIFDDNIQRDLRWVGRPEPRAFITRLTRGMIAKYQAYNGDKKITLGRYRR
jgi:hypothetical protein